MQTFFEKKNKLFGMLATSAQRFAKLIYFAIFPHFIDLGHYIWCHKCEFTVNALILTIVVADRKTYKDW